MYVCMELIQIHISKPMWTKLCTRLPLGLEETVGYVWTPNFRPLQTFGPFLGVHCRIMGTRWLPSWPFSAIKLYPWFQLVFAWRHRHYVFADGGFIRGSLISVILTGVSPTSRKCRRSRRQSHSPQRRIPYSGGCSRHVTYITFNRATGPSATALYPSFQLLFLWPTGNHVLADDSCAFLLQVCCTVGNAYDTLGRERDPCVYSSEPHQTGRKWQRNYNYTNNSNLSNLCPSMRFQISASAISHPGQRRVPPLVYVKYLISILLYKFHLILFCVWRVLNGIFC